MRTLARMKKEISAGGTLGIPKTTLQSKQKIDFAGYQN